MRTGGKEGENSVYLNISTKLIMYYLGYVLFKPELILETIHP